MSAEDELAEVEQELKSLDWMVTLLYETQKPLIARRNALRARVEQARARDLKRAREYYGEGVSER